MLLYFVFLFMDVDRNPPHCNVYISKSDEKSISTISYLYCEKERKTIAAYAARRLH